MKLFPNKLTSQLEKIEEYQSKKGVGLGAALERLLPHTPLNGDVVMFKGYIVQEYICSNCSRVVGDEFFMFNFCPNCGCEINKEGVKL